MILNLLRLICLALLFVGAFINVRTLEPFALRADVQIIAAIVLVLVTIIDVSAGIALGLAAIAVWLRVGDLNKGPSYVNKSIVKNIGDNIQSVKVPYVTPDNLKDAQSNVVNRKDYDNGVKGITGSVYGVQGLDKDMPGYVPFI